MLIGFNPVPPNLPFARSGYFETRKTLGAARSGRSDDSVEIVGHYKKPESGRLGKTMEVENVFYVRRNPGFVGRISKTLRGAVAPRGYKLSVESGPMNLRNFPL